MFGIKNIDISDKAIDKILSMFKTFWFDVPPWLRNLLIVVIILGGGYFLYARLSMSYDVSSLQEEIAVLNERCTTTVFYDRYIYDISNLIEATRSLEYEIDLLYSYHNEMTLIVMHFLDHHHPDQQLIEEVHSLQKRMEHTKDAYDKVLQYQISLYENWTPKGQHYEKNLIQRTDSVK